MKLLSTFRCIFLSTRNALLGIWSKVIIVICNHPNIGLKFSVEEHEQHLHIKAHNSKIENGRIGNSK